MASKSGRLLRASREAIELAARMPPRAADRARFLYRFGTIPLASPLVRDLGMGDEPLLALGLSPGGRARRLLEPRYEVTTFPHWMAFRRHQGSAGPELRAKLYISPAPRALPEAMVAIARVLADSEAPAFKIGRGIAGLLRPDKLVCHFPSLDHLASVAARLARALAGSTPHGVPFSATLDAGGLLSWGIDPPAEAEALSWRSHVTASLARAMDGLSGPAAVDAALGAAAEAGIDPATWAPAGACLPQRA